MKSRSRKLGKIAHLAASEERRFAELTGRARQHLEEQAQRLGELNAYRHDYATKSASASMLSSAHWKDYQTFLYRLDKAVTAQQQIVRDSEQRLETIRQQWIARRRRLESLERVIEKYRAEERVQASRREQKQLDELPNNQASFLDDE